MSEPRPNLVCIETDRSVCTASVIQTLEGLLERARAGEFIAVAVGFVRTDGAISSERSRTEDVGRLLGAVSLCQSRILHDIDT